MMRLGVILAALAFVALGAADAQQICCSGGGGGGGGSITYPLMAPNGSGAAPSYSFSNGPDSGIYASGNRNVDIKAGTVASGAAPTLTITSGATQQNFTNGGALTITSGGAGTNASSGDVTVQSAPSNGGAVSGSVNIVTGTAGPGSPGGDIKLTPGVDFFGNIIGNATARAGATSSQFHLGGPINAALISTGNTADTNEDTLQIYSLPAKALDSAGRCIRITSWGITANNADTKVIKVYFGSVSYSSGTSAFTNVSYWLQLTVCKTGSNTQTIIGTGYVGSTVLAPAHTAGTETDTSAIVIKTTGQAGAANANDIVGKAQIIEYLS